MAKQKGAAVSDRLAGKTVFFSGKFGRGNAKIDGLHALVTLHGGKIAKDLGDKTDFLVLADANAGKTVQKKVDSLNKKGAAIQVVESDAFATSYSPTAPEFARIIRSDLLEQFSAVCRADSAKHAIEGENFDGADLSQFQFHTLNFIDCSFVSAKLNGTIFRNARGCDFSKVKAKSAAFIRIADCRFTDADLKGVRFTFDISGCDFQNANLEGSFFLSELNGEERIAPRFVGANLKKATIGQIHIKSAVFDDADLSQATFEGKFESSSFRRAKMHGASLQGAKFPDCDFSEADLTEADLSLADLTSSRFDRANLSGTDFDSATLTNVDFSTALNYQPASRKAGQIGPALTELDNLAQAARKIELNFLVKRGGAEQQIGIDTGSLKWGWPIRAANYHRFRNRQIFSFSDAMMELARMFGNHDVRFETLDLSSTKCPKTGAELRELIFRGIEEAFTQSRPASDKLAAATKAYREKVKESTAAQREARDKARQQAVKQQEKAKKQVEKRIEKEVGKVTDTASFLKALELRIEPEKIKKATKMLKASKFQLYNDVTNSYTSGVVKSQTDPDLVYACQINHDGTYACCTQNLNICGGLRGSICKHLLVLIIGLVNANQLDPITIDDWVARSQNSKPVLDKEKMGDIFIKYKGAEAGEIDWRPTETLPEDYYSL